MAAYGLGDVGGVKGATVSSVFALYRRRGPAKAPCVSQNLVDVVEPLARVEGCSRICHP